MKRSVISLPLHHGWAPRRLFGRMERFSAAVAGLIVIEHRQRELIRRPNPFRIRKARPGL